MICEIVRIFACAFYGSPLWALQSEEHFKLNRSWNTVIKMIWDLPFSTHKRFVESMVELPHLQSMLHGRYIGFMENLSSTIKPHLQIIFTMCLSDQSCNTGENLPYLLNLYETYDLRTLILKKHTVKINRVNPILEGEEWKCQMIKECVSPRWASCQLILERMILRQC